MLSRLSFKYPEDIDTWRKLYPAEPDGAADPSADQWLGKVLVEYQHFCNKYHSYFEEEPNGIIPKGLFDASKTTVARLHQRVLQALEDYFSTIGRVAEQRQVEHYRTMLDDGTSKAKVFLRQLNLDLPVLLYFDKATGVQHYPFTAAVFVGTPYQSAFEGDWMSIPHEIGHYLYWNLGQDTSGKLTLGNLADSRRWQEKLKACVDSAIVSANVDEQGVLKRMLLSWLEEIFADVVGTRIGGQPFVDSLLKRIERFAGGEDDLKEDDGEHPPLCLRPLVRTHTLKLNGEASATDFGRFFVQAFNIPDVSSLKLQAILEPPKESLHAIKAADQAAASAESLSISLEASRVIPALEQLVSCLNAQIGGVLGEGLPKQAQNLAGAFDRLVARAEEEVQLNGRRPYENLLEPIILEGGEYHSGHRVVYQEKWHWIGPHNH